MFHHFWHREGDGTMTVHKSVYQKGLGTSGGLVLGRNLETLDACRELS